MLIQLLRLRGFVQLTYTISRAYTASFIATSVSSHVRLYRQIPQLSFSRQQQTRGRSKRKILSLDLPYKIQQFFFMFRGFTTKKRRRWDTSLTSYYKLRTYSNSCSSLSVQYFAVPKIGLVCAAGRSRFTVFFLARLQKSRLLPCLLNVVYSRALLLQNLVSGYECGRVFPAGVEPGSPSRDADIWLSSRLSRSAETRRWYGWLRIAFPRARLFRAPAWCTSGGGGTRETRGTVAESLRRSIGWVRTRFGEGGGQLDRRRARRVLNLCARESRARTGRFQR